MTDAAKPFQCPKCETSAQSGRGWKHHMTHAHGGYTDEEYAAACAAASAAPGMGASPYRSLDDAKANAPESETAPQDEEKVRRPKKPKEPTINDELSGQLTSTLAEVSDVISNAVDKLLFSAKPLSTKEKKALDETTAKCFGIFGVDFQIQKRGITITNPIWLVLLPLALIGLFMARRFEVSDVLSPTEPDNGNHRSEGEREDLARDPEDTKLQ